MDIIIDKQGKLIPPADTIRSGGVDTICPVVLGILTKIRFKQKPIQEEMGEQEQEQEQKVVPGSNNTRTPASPHDNEQCVKAVSKCVIWEADNDSLDKDITREFAERCVPDQPGGWVCLQGTACLSFSSFTFLFSFSVFIILLYEYYCSSLTDKFDLVHNNFQSV